jgi:hypothetical protein
MCWQQFADPDWWSEAFGRDIADYSPILHPMPATRRSLWWRDAPDRTVPPARLNVLASAFPGPSGGRSDSLVIDTGYACVP